MQSTPVYIDTRIDEIRKEIESLFTALPKNTGATSTSGSMDSHILVFGGMPHNTLAEAEQWVAKVLTESNCELPMKSYKKGMGFKQCHLLK